MKRCTMNAPACYLQPFEGFKWNIQVKECCVDTEQVKNWQTFFQVEIQFR